MADPKRKHNEKAWQKSIDKESSLPYSKSEESLFAKGRKALKDLGHKPKQKAGPEARKVANISKSLKKKHGSVNNAARDPKVKKKVDGIYNKMLEPKSKPGGGTEGPKGQVKKSTDKVTNKAFKDYISIGDPDTRKSNSPKRPKAQGPVQSRDRVQTKLERGRKESRMNEQTYKNMWDSYMKMYENYGTGNAKRAAHGNIQQRTSAKEAERLKAKPPSPAKPVSDSTYRPKDASGNPKKGVRGQTIKGGMSDAKAAELRQRVSALKAMKKESYSVLERYNGLDKQAKLDKMATRGTPNERKVAQKKLNGPSLPKFD